MHKISISDTVGTVKEIVSCDLIAESVLLDLNSGIYYGVEGIGRAIWELIQTPKSVNELISHFTTQYDVAPEACENEVLSFLNDMLAHKLVMVQNDAVAP